MVRPLTPLALVGPTGSGKTSLAMALAERLDGEIVGCDSVQLYRGFDIGSAKPTREERKRVPHHLVDLLAWNEDCDAAQYATLARAAIADVQGRGRVPIVTGGTGLYLRSLTGAAFHDDLPKDAALRASFATRPLAELYAELQRLDPKRASEIHANDRFRVARSLELFTLLGKPLSALPPPPQNATPPLCVVILDPERAALHASIERRTREMLAGGLLDEVRGLLAAGVERDCKPMRSIGYKEGAEHMAGTLAEPALEPAIAAATRQYAKRQVTWFKKTPAALRLARPDVDAVIRRWSATP